MMNDVHTSNLHTLRKCRILWPIAHNQARFYTVLEVSLSIPEPNPLRMHLTVLREFLLTIILMRMILFFVMAMAMNKIKVIISCIVQSNIIPYRFPYYRSVLPCFQSYITVRMVSVPGQSGAYICINQTFCLPNHIGIFNRSSLQLTTAPDFVSTTESYAHPGVGVRCFSAQLQSVPSSPCVDM